MSIGSFGSMHTSREQLKQLQRTSRDTANALLSQAARRVDRAAELKRYGVSA